jgi:hypothetical protein
VALAASLRASFAQNRFTAWPPRYSFSELVRLASRVALGAVLGHAIFCN